MNAALGDLLFKLIGSFSGDTSPQKNPYFGQQPGDVDPSFKGDPSDLVQQPYSSPNWATRFFHPDVASAETSRNLEAYNALIDNATKNTVGASNVNLIAPYAGQQFSNVSKANPRAASVLYPNLSTEGILSGDTSAADIANNIPALGSIGRLARAQDIIRSSSARLSSGSPEKEVAAGNAQSDYTTRTLPSDTDLKLGSNALEMSLLPSYGLSRGFGNIASAEQSKREIKGGDKLDALFSQGLDTRLNEGSIADALSKDRASNIPSLVHMANQERLNATYNLMHPELSNSPFFRDTATGMAVKNPAFINLMDMMNAKMAHSSMPNTILLPGSGLHMVVGGNKDTTQSVTPTIGQSKNLGTHTVQINSKEIELPNDPAYVKAKRGQLINQAQDKFRQGTPLSKEEISFFTPAELREIYGLK